MDKFYTAAAIAKMAIEGLPTSKAAIHSRAKKEGWEYREKKVRGGTCKEYRLTKRYLVGSSASLSSEAHEAYLVNAQDYEIWASKVDRSKFIPIRYCNDLQMLCETNLFSSRNAANALFFRKKFITQELNAQPKNLICIPVQSDSMGTTIRKTGVAMFDLSKGYRDEGVYLIKYGDGLKIKRIQKRSATTMLIISDYKEAYPEIEVDISKTATEEFAIMGTYLWDAGITV